MGFSYSRVGLGVYLECICQGGVQVSVCDRD